MNRRIFLLPLALTLLFSFFNYSAAQQTAPAKGGNPFDGEWSLQLSIATAPGGVSTQFHSPYNSIHVVNNRRFEVEADGTFEWLARHAGKMHDDGVNKSGTSSFQNDFQLHLRGRGKVELPPETGAPERPGNRRLNLHLTFLLGDGRGSAVNSGGYAFSVGVSSADSAQMTFTSYPGGNVVTVAGAHQEMTWPELHSTSVSREEISPEVIVETIRYEARRQGTMGGQDQEVPVTDRIEVTHVRYLNLVPRG